MPALEEVNYVKQQEKNNKDDSKYKYNKAAFLIGISSISLLSGFGYAIGISRKSDPEMFDKGMMKTKQLHYAGSQLALKALGWGTVYAITGVSLFCYSVWKISGAKNMQEFRTTVGNILPRIPKNDPPQSRTEFSSLTDLLQYVIDEDNFKKQQKQIEDNKK